MAEINIKDEAQKIVHALANALKQSVNSPLCFCGTGKLYRECCEHAPADKLITVAKELESAVRYRDSQGGHVDSLPVGLINRLLQKGINRLSCLYPGCSARPVSCHLIPENTLRAVFGGHCLDYRMRDGTDQVDLIKTGVRNAGVWPVFCSRHDNDLFRETDALGTSVSAKHQFLLSLKAVAFSLRKTQILLSLDSQMAIFRPILLIRSGNTIIGGHYTINIDHLSEQYQRFHIAHTSFQQFVETLERQDWDSFAYLQRSIPYSGNLFYAGFINPSHDLRKQKIITTHTPIHMTLSIFSKDGVLRTFFACPDGASKDAYAALFYQLGSAQDHTLVAVINTILTYQTETLLVPETVSVTTDDMAKMKELRRHNKECRLSSSEKFLDLAETSQAVPFIAL